MARKELNHALRNAHADFKLTDPYQSKTDSAHITRHYHTCRHFVLALSGCNSATTWLVAFVSAFRVQSLGTPGAGLACRTELRLPLAQMSRHCLRHLPRFRTEQCRRHVATFAWKSGNEDKYHGG